MILRSTKKFFHKTFQSVRSFLSGGAGYQKLPKENTTPLFDPYSHGNYVNAACSQASHSELDKFHAEFPDDKNRRGRKKTVSSLDVKKQEKEFPTTNNTVTNRYMEGRREDHGSKTGGTGARPERRGDPVEESNGVRDRRSFLVAKKMKELEVIDVGNMDHVTDIEEVLHYYSLLTCPAYLDIIDKFFMQMYAEFLGINATLKSSHSSKPGQWTIQG